MSEGEDKAPAEVPLKDRKEVEMDRVVKDVVAPPMWPLTSEQLFDKDGKPRLDVLKAHLLKEGRLEWTAAKKLLDDCTAILKKEPNILELKYPITVCGDVHGQFFDLVRLFEVGGDPKETQYLFLGDYVDRGCFSTECVFYLWALKISYPNTFFLLRGNHECRQLTAFFNFKDECTYKYDQRVYDAIMDSFDTLPLAAIINKAFFCVHGGLSPDIHSLSDISKIHRFQEIPREGAMCDLMWSDPYEEDVDQGLEAGEVPQTPTKWFGFNDTRQCSYVYGIEAVIKFLRDNKLTSIIRAHEAQVDGYKMQMVNKKSCIPRVITIFSAPNYCDVYGNKAACLKFDHNVLNIKQFIESAHPYYLPNFMDVFQWSLPFVAEKVTDMLASVLDYGASEEGEDEGKAEAPNVLEGKGQLLKNKVKAVSKLMRMYKILREENDSIVALKQLVPGSKVPPGLLTQGAEAIQKAINDFSSARKADLQNERRPTPDGKEPVSPRSPVPPAGENPPDLVLAEEDEVPGAETPKIVLDGIDKRQSAFSKLIGGPPAESPPSPSAASASAVAGASSAQ